MVDEVAVKLIKKILSVTKVNRKTQTKNQQKSNVRSLVLMAIEECHLKRNIESQKP